jgi:acyl-CoA thioester hydrolase
MIDPQDGLQLLYARVLIDFLAQIRYPGHVDVATATDHVGTSSYSVQQALFQNGVCCASATATLVKAKDGKPSPLTPSEREALVSYGHLAIK